MGEICDNCIQTRCNNCREMAVTNSEADLSLDDIIETVDERETRKKEKI